MNRFARLLHRHYWLSALLLGCLVLRAFVPAGYMIDTAGGDLSLKMCSGTTLTIPGGDHGSDEGNAPDNGGPTGGHHGACPAGVPLLALAYALTLSTEAPTIVSALPAAEEPARSSIPPSPSRLPRGPPSILHV
ncbi:MAG: hypothetical protein RLZZ393_687 [Pseudomonadota bacterium]